MNDKIKLAFLGCGDVAQRDYLPEFHRVADRAELVAVAGRTERRARAVAQEYGFQTWYTDYERMLIEAEVDAVVNLTPMQLHAETNLAVLQAGKHLFTEKPVASRLWDGLRIQEEARQRGLKLVCAPCVMLFPQVQFARSVLDESQIGQVYAARGHGHGGVPPWRGYTSDPSQFFTQGGGPALDMGVYPLHGLTGLVAPARWVTAMTSRVLGSFTVPDGPAQGKQVTVDVEDNWHMLLNLGQGRLATIAANNCVQATRAPQLELFGLGGSLALNLLNVAAPVDVFQPGEGWQSVSLPRTGREAGPDHLLGVEHLLACIRDDVDPVLTVAHAVHVLEIIEKAAQSAIEGRTLELETTF